MSVIEHSLSLPNIHLRSEPAAGAALRGTGDPLATPGLNSIRGQSADRTKGNLAHELGMIPTLKGVRLSPGRAIAAILRLPGRCFRALGNAIQGPNQHFSASESKSRYFAGGFFKTIGNVLGATAGLVGGALVYAEHKVSDLGGFALRLAGASVLGILAVGAYGVGSVFGNTTLGARGLEAARDLVLNAPIISRRTEHPVTADVAAEFKQDLAAAMGQDVPRGRYLATNDVPTGVKERFKFAPSTVVDQFGIGSDMPLITTGGWTKLTIKPSWNEAFSAQEPNKPRILYLNFHGSNLSSGGQGFKTATGLQGLANLRTDMAQALGIPDGAFREARDIAKMFVDHYADNPLVTVRLVGHSMGGALAQFSGIAVSTADKPVRVTCFNSAGLHPHLLEKLGAEKINNSDVTHFINSGDPMRWADGKNAPFVPSLNVGVHYKVPSGSADHGMAPIEEHFENLAQNGGA